MKIIFIIYKSAALGCMTGSAFSNENIPASPMNKMGSCDLSMIYKHFLDLALEGVHTYAKGLKWRLKTNKTVSIDSRPVLDQLVWQEVLSEKHS